MWIIPDSPSMAPVSGQGSVLQGNWTLGSQSARSCAWRNDLLSHWTVKEPTISPCKTTPGSSFQVSRCSEGVYKDKAFVMSAFVCVCVCMYVYECVCVCVVCVYVFSQTQGTKETQLYEKQQCRQGKRKNSQSRTEEMRRNGSWERMGIPEGYEDHKLMAGHLHEPRSPELPREPRPLRDGQ